MTDIPDTEPVAFVPNPFAGCLEVAQAELAENQRREAEAVTRAQKRAAERARASAERWAAAGALIEQANETIAPLKLRLFSGGIYVHDPRAPKESEARVCSDTKELQELCRTAYFAALLERVRSSADAAVKRTMPGVATGPKARPWVAAGLAALGVLVGVLSC